MFSEETETKIRELKEKYPHKHSAILPSLHIILKEVGWAEPESMKKVAEILELPPIEIFETASFYTMFPKNKVGKCLIQVCTNLSCMLSGAEQVVKHLEDKLKIKVGETTPDGLFTLTTVECLGSCGTAPMMQINDKYYENLTKKKIDEIIDELSQQK